MTTGKACDCSGDVCTDAEFCYDESCNANAKGNLNIKNVFLSTIVFFRYILFVEFVCMF